MGFITKKNAIDRPRLELVQLLPFLKDKSFAPKHMEVTHLGCSDVHQLVVSFLLMDPEVNPVGHIACGIDRLSLEPSGGPMLVEHRPSHPTQGSVFPFHHAILGGAYTD
jgi:hypothetical protein